MKEMEITVEVFDSLEHVLRLLEEKNYKLLEKYDINDFYYSKYSIEELKNFKYKDLIANSFLLREIIDDKPKNLLTYKNKELDANGNVIAEEKIKCEIKDLSSAIKIFNLAGINCWSKLNQHLYVFKKGTTEFSVQVVEDLGIFIEYEENGSMSGLSAQEKINYMLNEIKKLGIKVGDDFSCKKIFLKFKKENNK